MSLIGAGFLAIWHGLDKTSEQAFEAWHTSEHMPERLGISGFLRGRRYMRWTAAPHVCFTLYEATHPEVFRSPAYLARLNAPTPWTQQIMPHMNNFLRGACETIFTAGSGIGATLAVLRLNGDDSKKTVLSLKVAALEITQYAGVVGVHLGLCKPEITSQATNEATLRKSVDTNSFSYVLLVEALDANYLKNQWHQLIEQLTTAQVEILGTSHFDLSFMLNTPKA